MSLIKIDLNQTISKAQLEHAKKEKNRWILSGIIMSAFLINIIFLFYIRGTFQTTADTYFAETRKFEKETTRLTKQQKEKNNVTIGDAEVLDLYSWEKSRILWSSKLKALSDIAPPDMTIERIELKGNLLFIDAIIDKQEKEMNIPDQFVKGLQNDSVFSKDFTDIKHFENKTRPINKFKEVTRFKVKATLKPGKGSGK